MIVSAHSPFLSKMLMLLDSISHKMFLPPHFYYPQIMFNFDSSIKGLFLNLNSALMEKPAYTYSVQDLKALQYSLVDLLLLKPFLLSFRKRP